MAEEKGKAKPEAEAPKPKGKGKGLLIAILVMGVAGAGGAGYMFMKMKQIKSEATKEAEAPPEMGPLLELPELVVNLNDPSGNRYLKLSLKIELAGSLTPRIQALIPRFKDQLILYLSGQNVGDLIKPGAKLKMKRFLLEEANRAFGKGSAKAIYFNDFVMQ